MRALAKFTLLVLVALPAAVQAQSDDPTEGPASNRLDLVCAGAGAANKSTQSTANAWNSEGEMATVNVAGSRAVPFEDQIKLWVDGADGRIRMPRAMLPAIRGGEDGWFKLKSIKTSETEITASVAVNPLNNPKLRIDRLTGAISLSGKAGDYSGRCQKFDPSSTQRAF